MIGLGTLVRKMKSKEFFSKIRPNEVIEMTMIAPKLIQLVIINNIAPFKRKT